MKFQSSDWAFKIIGFGPEVWAHDVREAQKVKLSEVKFLGGNSFWYLLKTNLIILKERRQPKSWHVNVF